MQFKDHFSDHAQTYADFRPLPPRELIQQLATLAPTHDCAWDCATGNGQAARLLAHHFTQVIATDASPQQIEIAPSHPRIEYRVALAENSGLQDRSSDLVTVGAAIHWFDQPRFYEEVKRILKPGGVIALWGYNSVEVVDGPNALTQAIRQLLKHFEPYLSPEAYSVWHGYGDLLFPFDTIEMPAFFIQERFNLEQFLGFIYSTSAAITWIKQEGQDPLEVLLQRIREGWGAASLRPVRWPLCMRVGRFIQGH